jgi:hypothetical protein
MAAVIRRYQPSSVEMKVQRRRNVAKINQLASLLKAKVMLAISAKINQQSTKRQRKRQQAALESGGSWEKHESESRKLKEKKT